MYVRFSTFMIEKFPISTNFSAEYSQLCMKEESWVELTLSEARDLDLSMFQIACKASNYNDDKLSISPSEYSYRW